MAAARRGARIAAIAGSALVHLVVLAVVALHSSRLFIPNEPSGPPEPIIPVLLMPRLPPPTPSAAIPAGPIRLHRRQQRIVPPDLQIAPLPAPERPQAAPAVAGPVTLRPAPLPEGPRQEVQAALRRSPIGCANPQAAGLSRDEREVCEERLGKAASDTPFMGLGLGGGKQTTLDKAGARREADRVYRDAIPPQGVADPKGGSDQPWQVRPDPHK